MWKTRPKAHSFSHAIRKLTILRLNPRFFMNFAEEDLMGKLKKIGSKTHARSASLRILQRYLLYTARRWNARKSSVVWTHRTQRKVSNTHKHECPKHMLVKASHPPQGISETTPLQLSVCATSGKPFGAIVVANVMSYNDMS